MEKKDVKILRKAYDKVLLDAKLNIAENYKMNIIGHCIRELESLTK